MARQPQSPLSSASAPISSDSPEFNRIPQIRWMIRRDLHEVVKIERAAFPHSPWSEDEFIEHLRHRNIIGMVAEIDEKIVGYMLYELLKKRLDVLNFAVDPAHQRTGIGRTMFEKLQCKLHYSGRTKIVFRVLGANLPMQLFLRSCGVRAVRCFQDVDGDDAIRFEYDLLGGGVGGGVGDAVDGADGADTNAAARAMRSLNGEKGGAK